MKKLLALLFTGLSAAVFAGANDLLISFSTPGPDKYADGSTVLDGEFYALYYTDANGKLSAEPVLAAPTAKGGRCTPVLFVIDENEVSKYAGGTFSVFLLDTRVMVDGVAKPAAMENGKPANINLKAVVTDGIAQATGFASAFTRQAVKGSAFAGDIGATVPQPVIKGVQVLNSKVVVTVGNTKPFVPYALASSDGVTDFAVSEVSEPAYDGEGNLQLTVPQSSNAKFYKVTTFTK